TCVYYLVLYGYSSILLFIFFYNCYITHLDLHSFPTRRSSDLKKIILVEQYRKPLERSLIEIPAGKLEPNEEPSKTAVRELEEERSEEHTSELQSRFDLVCRLLLEKKKKN